MENLFQIIEALGKEARRTHELALKPSNNSKKSKESFLEKFGSNTSNVDTHKIKRIEEALKKSEEENQKLLENKEQIKLKIKTLKKSLEKIK